MKRRRNPSLGNDPSVFRKHASLRILQDQIYKDKGQLVPLDTLREMILDMAKQARTAGWKVVEGGKRRANPGRDAAATAVAFLRKYGSQALGWAKTAASIHRGLRDRIFWRKVYNCILRSLKRGDPLPNPGSPIRIMQVPLTKLYSPQWKIDETLEDIRNKKLSFSNDKPLRLSKFGRGRYFLMDGNHRAIEALLAGKTALPGILDEHVPDMTRTGGAYKSVLDSAVQITSARVQTNPLRRSPTFGKRFVIQSPVGPVYRVDGAKVRAADVDGVGGWHGLVYPKLVPREEVWIEHMAGGPVEERYLLAHEMVEIALMRILKWGYQRAHDAANRAERKLRAGACPLKIFTAVLRRHMPGRYQLDVERAANDFYRAYKGYR